MDARRRGLLPRRARRCSVTTTCESRPALPGWSRAHVVSHFSRNARALINLLDWARTGVATPMYAVRRSACGRHRRRVTSVSSRAARRGACGLAAAAGRDRGDARVAAWDGEIRTALGRATTGAEVPWMRVRETWVHTVDLDAGSRSIRSPTPSQSHCIDEVTTDVEQPRRLPGRRARARPTRAVTGRWGHPMAPSR